MLVLYVFRYILNLSPLSSVAISFWVGFFIAFILQKIVTFKNYKRDIKTVTKQLVGYSALVAFNYTFTLVVVGAFHTSLNVIILRTITIAVITLWNFIIYRKLFSDSSNG
jgi:putative flippase GtrA